MALATIASVVGIAGTAYNIYNSSQQQSQGQAAIAASDPFGPYRAQYAQKLSSLMANPGSITKDPGYQFGMDQSLQGTARTMAAQGFLGSGNEAIELQKTGLGYASDYYQKSLANYANLAGAGTVPNATGAGLQAYGAGSAGIQSGFGQLGALMKTFGGSGTPNTSTTTGGAATDPMLYSATADMFSDRRLKFGIKRIGETASGQPTYEFEYIWGGGKRTGVMADESPAEAVSEGPGGFLMVDYSKII